MSVLRDVLPFDELWERRATLEIEGELVDLMSVEDLVRAKQAQRNKDWPMLERLVDRVYFDVRASPSPKDMEFLLRELRDPDLLIEFAAGFPSEAQEFAPRRAAIAASLSSDIEQARAALRSEQDEAIIRDRLWWEPLKGELEQFRHQVEHVQFYVDTSAFPVLSCN